MATPLDPPHATGQGPLVDPPQLVYLVRHGQTRLNANGLIRGHLDEPLDEVGLDQAEQLGQHFSQIPLAAIACSPLSRAVHTAAPIARARRIDLIVDPRLIDRDYGALAGEPLEGPSRRGSAPSTRHQGSNRSPSCRTGSTPP